MYLLYGIVVELIELLKISFESYVNKYNKLFYDWGNYIIVVKSKLINIY